MPPLRPWFAAALDAVWPRDCYLCAAPAGAAFCASCRDRLLRDPWPRCPRCSSPVGPYSNLADGCGRCRGESFRFAATVRLGLYDGLLRDAVLRAKQASGEGLAERLGELLAETRRVELLAANPAVVVPVPLHWRRRLWRGYNQSDALARGVARALGIPCVANGLRRVRATESQRGKSRTARKANVSGAFAGNPLSTGPGGTVVLVDDVLTTGATADAAAAALKRAGAAQVLLAVIAHR